MILLSMIIFIIETILYFIMAAMIRQLTQIKGIWPAIAFLVVFTVITEMPGEWLVLPLLFGALLLPCLMQWGLPVYVAAGLSLVPTLGLVYALHHYNQPLSLGGMGLPTDITNTLVVTPGK